MDERVGTICVVPAFNEEGKIGRVVEKIIATGEVNDVVVVDDGSIDRTASEAEAAGAEILRHEINMGVGAAIRSGLQYGIQRGYGLAVIMSGDDQHEPKELPRILEPLRRGEADFVQGSRHLEGGQTVDAPIFRELTTRLFSLVFTVLTGRRITDGTNGFRAFFLSILDDENIELDQAWLNTYELEPYLLYKAVVSGKLRVIEVPITIYYGGGRRQFSKMKPFRDWWRLARPVLFLKLGLRR